MDKNSSYWYCPNCKEELDGCHVTYQELCEYCGTAVLSPDEKLAVSMCAGARAIEQHINRMGKVYVYDVLKGEPTIPYLEAARLLRKAAEKALGGGEE